jgi:DNA invertase Pin-like site-specific DNA recombinase
MSSKIDINNENTIPFSDEQHQRMVDMYQGGATSREVATVFGIGQLTVLRRLRTLGVKIRPKGNPEFLK